MRPVLIIAVLAAIAPASTSGQQSTADLQEAMRAGDRTPSARTLLSATSAALNLRDYDAAEGYLEQAWEDAFPIFNGLVNMSIMTALSSGEGVVGAQRAFRNANATFNFTPINISAIAGNFPEILASGEYDDMVLSLSEDHPDPRYQCGCWNTKAWVHRLAGRHEEATAIWADLVAGQITAVNDAPNPSAEAQIRGQYARNLARAGQEAESRRQLEISMNTEVDEAALPAIRRRWAQTYAELGEVDAAVEHLEALLAMNSTISVHALESRAAWALIRDEPAFQAMLDRHR
jgi:tetratricopeptide (TPR) repeat protein